MDLKNTVCCVKKVSLFYRKRFETYCVLDNVSLNIPKGSIYALLGPSGCGKTSLIQCITGYTQPNSGHVTLNGLKPQDPKQSVKIGYMPQDIALHCDLKIGEMLTYFGRINFVDKKQLNCKIDGFIDRFGLPDRNVFIGNLSGGQKRRVSFVASVLHDPKFLILDEPTVGLDIRYIYDIWDYLINLAKSKGTTVIITTHYIEETRRAHLVGFMKDGCIFGEGAPQILLEQFQCSTLEDVFYRICVQKDDQKVKEIFHKIQEESATRLDENKSSNDLTHHSNNSRNKFFTYLFILQSLICKNWIQSLRNPTLLVFQYVIPIITLFGYCLCIGTTPDQLPVAIFNEEIPPDFSQLFLDHIDPKVIKQINVVDMDEALDMAKKIQVFAIIHIKQNFTENLISRYQLNDNVTDEIIESSTVKFHVDYASIVLAVTVTRTLEYSFTNFIKTALKELDLNPKLGQLPMVLQEAIHGQFKEGKPDYFGLSYFLTPGLMVIITYTISYVMALFIINMEKLDGMFERNFVAGISSLQIIFGHFITRFVFVSTNALLILFSAIFVFGAPCNGSYLTAFLVLIMQSATGLSHAMFVTALCPDFIFAVFISNGVLLFLFIISGALWPLASIPYWMKWVSFLTPTTYPVIGLRNIMARGMSFWDPLVLPCFPISMIYLIIFLIGSSKIW